MTQGRPTIKFWHMADLHLMADCEASDHGPSACDRCIKWMVLERRMLTEIRRGNRPDLMLLAGDLVEADDGWERAARRLQRFVEQVQAFGVVVVGVTGDHDPDLRKWRRAVGASWLLKTADTNEETGLVVRGVSGSPRQDKTRVGLARACKRSHPRGSIFLAHAAIARVPKAAVDRAGFGYCALGHRHRLQIQSTRGGTVLAYPGHLSSWWDGSGKAWPTYFIEGTVSQSGKVTCHPVCLQDRPYSAPSTRQFYIPHKYAKQSKGLLVLVNPPPDKTLKRARVSPSRTSSWRFEGSDRELRRVVFEYASEKQRQQIVARVLQATPKDVYVAPSHGEDWAERTKDYGAQLLKDVDRFVERSVKRAEKTETSDWEAFKKRVP